MVRMIMVLLAVGAVASASASWQDSQVQPPCSVCGSQLRDRGFGADNLGYDWSPKAWGGPAFPTKPQNEDERRGKVMSGYGRGTECANCLPGHPHYSNTASQKDLSQTETMATITSPVLGIRLRDDRRVDVEWPGSSMRWDGFRNGIPWDQMERRDGQAWDETGRAMHSKGDYAAHWSNSPNNDHKERPWTIGWHNSGKYTGTSGSRNEQPINPRPSYTDGQWLGGKKNYDSHTSPSRPHYENPSYEYQNSYDSAPPPQYQISQGYEPRPEVYIHRPTKPTSLEHVPHDRYASYPGIAIWNGKNPAAHNRPSYFTGTITEITSPSQSSDKLNPHGNHHEQTFYDNQPASEPPGWRPSFQDRYPQANYNKYNIEPNNDPYNTASHNSPNGYQAPIPRPSFGRDPYYNDVRYQSQPPRINYGGDGHRSPQQHYENRDRNPYSHNSMPHPVNNGHDRDGPASYSAGSPNGGRHTSASWNYGDDSPYRKSGGSYPPYRGGSYFTSSYLASASTPPNGVSRPSSESTEATTGSQ